MSDRRAPPPHLPPDVIPSPGVLVDLSHAYHACQSAFEHYTGMPLTRWRILYLLTRMGSCTQKDMSDFTRVDASAITRVVKSLEAERLVRRRRDPADNRLARVELTASGRAVVERVIEKRKAFIDRMLAGIDRQEIAALSEVLQRIERNLSGSMQP